eukprot:11225478-Lingulodinium_polyedra.AAC.1
MRPKVANSAMWSCQTQASRVNAVRLLIAVVPTIRGPVGRCGYRKVPTSPRAAWERRRRHTRASAPWPGCGGAP